jgi:hypothetical protein
MDYASIIHIEGAARIALALRPPTLSVRPDIIHSYASLPTITRNAVRAQTQLQECPIQGQSGPCGTHKQSRSAEIFHNGHFTKPDWPMPKCFRGGLTWKPPPPLIALWRSYDPNGTEGPEVHSAQVRNPAMTSLRSGVKKFR